MERPNRQRRSASVFILLSILAWPSWSAEPVLDHSIWHALVQKHVDADGLVDYAGLKNPDASSRLASYLETLESVDLERLSKNERLALFINAYNAFTISLIVDHYPVRSIKKIRGVSGLTGHGQWKQKRWVLGGQALSLDTLEHQWIRPMGDPRIHFALVCAAKSCPPLAAYAFVGDRLEEQLEERGRVFHQAAGAVEVSLVEGRSGAKPVMRLSSIFKWFRTDFLAVAPSLEEYVMPFVTEPTREFLELHRGRMRISYQAYDWSLNDQTGRE